MYCINKLYNESQGDVNDEFKNSEGKGGQGLGSIVSQSKDLVGPGQIQRENSPILEFPSK